MARIHTTEFSYLLCELVEQGFPVKQEHRRNLLDDGITELEVVVAFESMGCTSNGWDEPGEAAQWYIESNSTDPFNEYQGALTPEQEQWLVNHMEETVQAYAADSSNWYVDYDD